MNCDRIKSKGTTTHRTKQSTHALSSAAAFEGFRLFIPHTSTFHSFDFRAHLKCLIIFRRPLYRTPRTIDRCSETSLHETFLSLRVTVELYIYYAVRFYLLSWSEERSGYNYRKKNKCFYHPLSRRKRNPHSIMATIHSLYCKPSLGTRIHHPFCFFASFILCKNDGR